VSRSRKRCHQPCAAQKLVPPDSKHLFHNWKDFPKKDSMRGQRQGQRGGISIVCLNVDTNLFLPWRNLDVMSRLFQQCGSDSTTHEADLLFVLQLLPTSQTISRLISAISAPNILHQPTSNICCIDVIWHQSNRCLAPVSSPLQHHASLFFRAFLP
jgi:hypothetical protein